jgi:hypothetical protein
MGYLIPRARKPTIVNPSLIVSRLSYLLYDRVKINPTFPPFKIDLGYSPTPPQSLFTEFPIIQHAPLYHLSLLLDFTPVNIQTSGTHA